jgi:hypothetical protein
MARFWLSSGKKQGVRYMLQVSTEKTIFMQKAIYFVSRLIAARGIIELTDRSLNFQVSPLDASFGMKDLSIDLCHISDIKIEGGEIHPKVAVIADKKHEFVLSKGQELYDELRELMRDPLKYDKEKSSPPAAKFCGCGGKIDALYHYCPWCGADLRSSVST